jgi:hypothetical protein
LRSDSKIATIVFLLKFINQGGYNLESISASAVAVTKVLLGEPPEELPPLIASEAGTETIWLVAKEQSKYWKNVDPKSCEPREGMKSTHHFYDLTMLLGISEITYSVPGMCYPLLK